MDISGKVVHVGGYRGVDGERRTARIEGTVKVGDATVDVALSLETLPVAPIKIGDVVTARIGPED